MDRALDFVFHAEEGDTYTLTYDSSYGGEQTVTGVVSEAHLSEYTTLTTDDGVGYYVWNGHGVSGRKTGDVSRRSNNESRSRKVGTFVTAHRHDGGMD